MIGRKLDVVLFVPGAKFYPFNWFKYSSVKSMRLASSSGKTIVLRRGDVFGVKEFSSKVDLFLVVKQSQLKLYIPIAESETVMSYSKPYKGEIDITAEVKSKPKKIKIVMKPTIPKSLAVMPHPKKQREGDAQFSATGDDDQPHPVTESLYRRPVETEIVEEPFFDGAQLPKDGSELKGSSPV